MRAAQKLLTPLGTLARRCFMGRGMSLGMGLGMSLGWVAWPLSCAQATKPASLPAIRVALGGGMSTSGRFAPVPDRPDCQRFAYGQSAIRLRYQGPMPEVLLTRGDANSLPVFFDVKIDGKLVGVRSLSPDGDHQTLNKDLLPPAGGRDTHSLHLVRRSEALMGEIWCCGLRLPPGTTLMAPEPPSRRRLLFLGDSITAGYGNTGLGPHCPFTPAEENGSLAFAPLPAATFGADVEVVAWSGRGLWRNLDHTFSGTMPQLLHLALPEDSQSRWAAASAPVQAVVINLGTNDFSGGPVDGNAFTNAYVDLLADLRALYPEAHLVATLGPMLQDAPPTPGALTQARANLQAALLRRRIAGEREETLSFVDFPPQDGSLGYGCDWHPSLATHRAMAAQLSRHLQRMKVF